MMKKFQELNSYRVYGHSGLDTFDEYVQATCSQHAVERVREWYKNDGKECEIEEVAKIVKNWK